MRYILFYRAILKHWRRFLSAHSGVFLLALRFVLWVSHYLYACTVFISWLTYMVFCLFEFLSRNYAFVPSGFYGHLAANRSFLISELRVRLCVCIGGMLLIIVDIRDRRNRQHEYGLWAILIVDTIFIELFESRPMASLIGVHVAVNPGSPGAVIGRCSLLVVW